LENREENSVCKNEKYKERIDKLISELDKIEERHWKITYNTACESTVASETCNDPGTEDINKHRLTMNDSSEFKELLTQCKHLCDELHLDLNIANISS
jgi:hypothetical protein